MFRKSLLGTLLALALVTCGNEGPDDLRAAPPGGVRPPAPELWSFRVEYRTRRSPQFNWGPWREYKTIKGEYDTGRAAANRIADEVEARSKNHQARIVEKRIR